MLEKRDLQLVRLAVRRKWLTAEEGEDCLFLKRKLGERYTIEEVIRKRGYLDDAALAELSADTERLTRRRPAPAATAARSRPGAPAKSGTIPAASKSGPDAPGPRSGAMAPAPRSGAIPGAPESGAMAPAPRSGTTPERGAVSSASLARARAETVPPPTRPDTLPPSRSNLPAATPPSSIPSTPAPSGRASAPSLPRAAAEREATVLEAPSLPSWSPPAASAPERTVFDMPALDPRAAGLIEPGSTEEQTLLGMPAVVLPPSMPWSSVNEERTVVGVRIEDLMRDHLRAPERRSTLPPIAPSQRQSSLRGWSSADEQPTGPELDSTAALDATGELEAARRLREAIERRLESVPAAATSLDVRLPPPRTPALPQVVEPAPETLPEVPPLEEDEALLGPQGAWILKRVIGRGATAVVYLAEPAGGGEPVALKLLRGDLLLSSEAVERFRREARAAAAISSPHVVALRGMGNIGDRPFIALQYVDGFTLRERLDADEPPDVVEALRITRDVALALVASEAAGIVHRDVKPENVIVQASGEVYLTDFGLAREARSTQEGLTSISDTVVGTPNYMAPEQALGASVDHRTDLYALGATLFHVLTGKPPFTGRSSVSIIGKHVRAPVPDVAAIDPRVPPAVAALIQRLMAKIPEQRYASAIDLVEAIDQLLATLRPTEAKADRVVAPAAISGFAVTAALTTIALGAAVVLRTQGLAAWGSPRNIAVEAALGGAALVLMAMLMLGAIGLVRRGELPLPGSTSWLVTVKDVTGVLGAGWALAGAALGPPAALDVAVLALGIVVLASWVFGFFLRTAIARQRKDRGGHMLALFGDPRLRRWRRVHVPLLVSLAGLATARFAVLAYFQAS